tara:strand:- start:13837 stop:15102 length:1266 start_codon:yes stop_codon:yes gene_type:complete
MNNLKIKLLTVIVCICISSLIFAQKVDRNNISIITETQPLPLNEKAKIVEYKTYSYIEKYGEYEKASFANEKHKCEYDENGKVLLISHVYESVVNTGTTHTDGTKDGSKVLEQDSNSEKFNYNEDGKLIKSLIKKKDYNYSNKHIFFIVKYLRDNNDNIVGKNVYEKKYGRLKNRYTYKYDAQNRIIERIDYYGEDLVTDTYLYSYNEKNDISIFSHKVNNTTRETYFYSSDYSEPDSISCQTIGITANYNESKMKIYEYSWNNNGTWTVKNETIKDTTDFHKTKPEKSIVRKFYTNEDLKKIKEELAEELARKKKRDLISSQNVYISKLYYLFDENKTKIKNEHVPYLDRKNYYKLKKEYLYNSYVKIYDNLSQNDNTVDRLNQIQLKVIDLKKMKTRKLEKSLKDQHDLAVLEKLIMSF